MNRTQTPNEYMKKKTAEEGKKRDTGRSGSSPKKKRNWW
jgi:hypothetical protein